MADAARVAVVVVTYDALPWIEQCLDSLRGVETVVVDNGSSDGTVAFVRERFPDVRAGRGREPRARRRLEHRHSRDVEPRTCCSSTPTRGSPRARSTRLVDFADTRPRAAVVGPRLLNPDGTLQRSVRGFPTLWRLATEYFFLRKLAPRSSALNAFYAGGFDHDEVREVEVVMGACMLAAARGDRAGRRLRRGLLPVQRGDGLVLPVPRGRLGGRLLPRRRVRARARRVAQRAPLPREPPRAPALPLRSTAGRRWPSARGACCSSSLRLRGLVFRGERGRVVSRRRGVARVRRRGDARSSADRGLPLPQARVRDRRRARAGLAARARARRAQRLGDARLVARRRLRRARGHVRARLDADADARAARRRRARRRRRAGSGAGGPAASRCPRRAWALFWGAIVGVLLWVAAPSVQGDGLFHLARARKLLELDALSLDRVSEFADGSLHPGLRVPALARLPRADREGRGRGSRAGRRPPPVDPRAARGRRRVRGGLGALPADVGGGRRPPARRSR